MDFEYGALEPLQRFSINNLGDPWIESNYGVHAREFEVGVLDWFAELWNIEESEYWAKHRQRWQRRQRGRQRCGGLQRGGHAAWHQT